MKSRTAEGCWLRERVNTAEKDSEGFPVVRGLASEWTSECTSLTAGTEKEKTECDTIATRITVLRAAAETRARELRVLE